MYGDYSYLLFSLSIFPVVRSRSRLAPRSFPVNPNGGKKSVSFVSTALLAQSFLLHFFLLLLFLFLFKNAVSSFLFADSLSVLSSISSTKQYKNPFKSLDYNKRYRFCPRYQNRRSLYNTAASTFPPLTTAQLRPRPDHVGFFSEEDVMCAVTGNTDLIEILSGARYVFISQYAMAARWNHLKAHFGP